MKEIVQILLFGGFGFFLLWVGSSRWKRRYCCRKVINGKCVSVHATVNSGVAHTRAVFEYYYEGKLRTVRAVEDLSRRQRERFVPGQVYTLYVNPQKPGDIRCTSTVFKFEDFFLVVMGGFIFFGAVIMFFQTIFNFLL